MIDVAGNVGIPVQYRGEEVVLTPERLLSMFLKSLQGIAERSQGAPVTDVVLAVPAYFTDVRIPRSRSIYTVHIEIDKHTSEGIAERSQRAPVTDVVLAVPAYFTDVRIPRSRSIYTVHTEIDIHTSEGIAERSQGAPVTDVVLAVPAYLQTCAYLDLELSVLYIHK